MGKAAKFEELKGKVIEKIEGLVVASGEVYFLVEGGEEFLMNHDQDCCETVQIEEVVGDANDIIGELVVEAEEVLSADDPETYKGEYYNESHTWTFYKLATKKGFVVIRWLGESNGYYSESVSFERM